MSAETNPYTPSGLLQYLPAICSEDPFLGQFLLAFEKILLGREDAPAAASPATKGLPGGPGEKPDPDLDPRGLEQIIDGLAAHYNPSKTPAEFLPWLAQWTALTLRADMTLEEQRSFLAQVVRLYAGRGTEANLKELLRLFVGGATPTIELRPDDEPYFFHVTIKLPRLTEKETRRKFEIAQVVVELEKPAHTDYEMLLDTPSMQLGVYSTVGVDTLLGTAQ
ncbi:MAG: phage tail protein [Pyrinomonadaceae bacterium]